MSTGASLPESPDTGLTGALMQPLKLKIMQVVTLARSIGRQPPGGSLTHASLIRNSGRAAGNWVDLHLAIIQQKLHRHWLAIVKNLNAVMNRKGLGMNACLTRRRLVSIMLPVLACIACANGSGLTDLTVVDTVAIDVVATDLAPESTQDDLEIEGPGDLPNDVPSDLLDDVPAVFDTGLELSDVPPDVVIPEFLGGDRPAALFVPADYDSRKAWPLIMVLHGYGASGFLQAGYLGLSDRFATKGFVMITPEGTVDPDGQQFWNAFDSCCDFFGSDVDDVGYLRGLIAQAKQVLNIDEERVYLIGHSNGGFMSFRMACDASDVITAIVSIAGAMPVGQTCLPVSPVSILSIHGTNDETIEYDGGAIGGNATFVDAPSLINRWSQLDVCTVGPVVGAVTLDFDEAVPGNETSTMGWSACSGGTQVDHWKMTGSIHLPGFNEAFKEALLVHLQAQRRQKQP
jgi:polyhydroxybutyrate depolymerase